MNISTNWSTLEAQVLLLGGLVDALDGRAAGDEVVEVAHDAPLCNVTIQVRRRSPASTGLMARTLLRDGHSVRDLDEAVPDHSDVVLTEDEDAVVFLENPHHTEGQGCGVAPGQHRATLYKLPGPGY